MNLMKASGALLLGMALMAPVSSRGAIDRASEVGIKGRANANASLVASGQVVALAWGASTEGGVTDIYVAASGDGGRTFSAPTRVDQVAGGASLSGEQPPRVALIPRAGRDPSIVVVWTAKAPAGTRLLSARSDDRGRSFASPTVIPGSDGSGNRGWESIATSRNGDVVALWLDHRELSKKVGDAPTNHADHQHAASGGREPDGVARAQLSKLFFGRLDDPSSTRAVAGGVCYCCKTAVATGTGRSVYAAWRHVYPGNVRDVAFTMSTDGGQTFAPPLRISDDQWTLDGCPENGPALAVDAVNRIHVVWPTLVPASASASEPTLALFYAMSQDGRRFTVRQRIPTEGFPRHPQITLGLHGEVSVAWDEQASGVRRIALARGTVDGTGTARFVRQRVGDATPASYPVVATGDSGTIVVWTSGSPGQTMLRLERVPS